MMELAEKETRLNDSTTVPLGWMVAGIGACLTAFMVLAGALIWATRLEARADNQGEKITKVELRQEQYDSNQLEVQKALIEIKLILNQKGN